MVKKLSKTEINKIMKGVSKQIYISDETYHEEFRQVIYKGKYYNYIISSFGRIFSIYYSYCKTDRINLKIMNPTPNKKGYNEGYNQILLTNKGVGVNARIHQLVALAFIENPNNYKIINHKDGVKSHNYVWNLEWCTNSTNTKHAYDTGLYEQPKGENRSTHKYTNKDIYTVCELLSNNMPVSKISEISNVPKRMIRHILKQEVWTHITTTYNFQIYNGGKPSNYKEQIKKVCELLESNKHTMKEISKQTGITYAMVQNILNKKAHTAISNKYKISNFNNYETNRKGR